MGAKVDSEGEGSSGGSSLADLNITPLVDVLLVLLMIFMVATPFAVAGINIQLPRTKLKAMEVSNQKSKEPISISVNEKGEFYIGKDKMDPEKIIPQLTKLRNNDNEAQIFIRADKVVQYGKVMEAMSAAQVAGFTKIGMLGEAAMPSRR